MTNTRRNFLRTAAAGLMAVPFQSSLRAENLRPQKTDPATDTLSLGIASYTFKDFCLDEVINMTHQLAISRLSLKSMHLPYDLPVEGLKAEADKVRAAGIDLYALGVIYMTTEKEVDQAFAYARNAGVRMIVGVPEHTLLARCQQKVVETGICLAIHNHGPQDKRYPSPGSIYERIKGMDPRMGICLDIGHTVRSGLDLNQEASRFMDRILDVHIKDVSHPSPAGKTVEIGRGVIDIAPFLKLLQNEPYNGTASFEFEKDSLQPMPGLSESVGYVRGALDALRL